MKSLFNQFTLKEYLFIYPDIYLTSVCNGGDMLDIRHLNS